MAESVVGKEEEERHQKLVTENEQLKKQVEEVLMSHGMRFPTIWHFDMCRLRRASAAPVKLRNSKWCSVSSLTVIEYIQATCKGSDQTERMRRLIWGFAGCIYYIVVNLMLWLISTLCILMHSSIWFDTKSLWLLIGPCHDEICVRGFWQSEIQTSLLGCRD